MGVLYPPFSLIKWYLPDEFLKEAYELRHKYSNTNNSVLDQHQSHFNRDKIMGLCELCKKDNATEIHHLQYQTDANENNYIGDSFNKNHKANLISICEECHDKIHSGEINGPTVKKKTTKGIRGFEETLTDLLTHFLLN